MPGLIARTAPRAWTYLKRVKIVICRLNAIPDQFTFDLMQYGCRNAFRSGTAVDYDCLHTFSFGDTRDSSTL